MMEKWGPWRISEERPNGEVVIRGEHGLIVGTAAQSDREHTALANARLWVAAPKFVEVLRAMLPEYGWALEYDEDGDRARMCLHCHKWQFFGEGEIEHADWCPVEKGKALLVLLEEP